jgi:UDP-glucose 4-epimerase
MSDLKGSSKGIILITGGSGFIGRALVAGVQRENRQIIATSTVPPLASTPTLRWVQWDSRQQRIPDVNWAEIDTIIHLAVPRNPFQFPNGANVVYRVTVDATQGLLQAAQENGVRRFVLASTGDVLGGTDSPSSENSTRYAPSSYYGAAKAAAEQIALAYRSVVSVAVARLFHPFGPGGDAFLINRLLNRVINNEAVTIAGNPGIRLNPVWIDDLVTGLVNAIDSKADGVFHFGGPETLTLDQIVVLMGEVGGVSPQIVRSPDITTERHNCDFSRSAAELMFSPKVGIRMGLEQLLTDRITAR